MRRLWHHQTEPAEGTGLIIVIAEPGIIRRRWTLMGIREEQRKDMVSCSTKSRGDSVTGFWSVVCPGKIMHSSGTNNEVEREAAAKAFFLLFLLMPESLKHWAAKTVRGRVLILDWTSLSYLMNASSHLALIMQPVRRMKPDLLTSEATTGPPMHWVSAFLSDIGRLEHH